MTFDAAARTYDADFTHTPLARWLRDLVRSDLPFQAGDHILEIGCGTGEDALWLAQQGIMVTATDASAGMLAEAERKLNAAGVGERVRLQQLDINRVGAQPVAVQPRYDGLFANFGVLNCAEDRRALVEYLAGQVGTGGSAVLVVMSPVCPWEIGWHLLHGQIRQAFRRFRSGIEAHAGGGQMVRVWYPSPWRLRRDFAPYFRHVQTTGIGVVLPPSYLNPLVQRAPGVFARLARLERSIGRFSPLLNDHYLMVLERR